MTINISSAGIAITIFNSVFENAVKAEIKVITTAGNYAKDATNFSSDNLKCIIADAIGSTDGQKRLVLQIMCKNREQPIIHSAGVGKPDTISFDKKGKATIKNAMHCKI